MFNNRNNRHLFFCIGVLVAVFGDSTLAANVTLAWNPSTDPAAAGYHVYYWNAGTATSNLLFAAGLVSVGNVTSATVTNLVAGSTYTFGATTIDASGLESPLSNEITYQVPAGAVVAVPTNHPPTLNTIAALTIGENAGPQTVSLAGITSGASNEIQTLTVTAAASDTNLISALTVKYTSPKTNGTLFFSPGTNDYGTAVITVTVNDGGASNNLVTQSFTVTVNQMNQTPTMDPLNDFGILKNSGTHVVNLTGITSGLTNKPARVSLTVTATSSNPTLIPTLNVNYTSPNTNGTLSLAPSAAGLGSATITVTVNNNQASNNIFSRTFTVTVLPLASTPPSITSPPTNTLAIAGQTASFSVTAAGTAPLIYQWQCNATNLAAGTNATLNLTNISTSQAGQYSVNISNLLGATNATATLAVYATAAANLVAANPHPAGQFMVAVAGVTGYTYAVQASTNLTNWVSLLTNTAPFTYTDTNAGKFMGRFYRTVNVQ